MAGNRTELMDIKQIIALKLKGVSNRKIGVQLSISRNTINHYTKFFEEQNLSYQEIKPILTASCNYWLYFFVNQK